MAGKTYVPRWLHVRKTIQAGTIELIDSELFANNDLWPMQLHWLSVTGTPVNDTVLGDYGLNSPYGGIARRLFFEIGISQKSDSAINYALTGSLMCHKERLAQHGGPFDFGLCFQFPGKVVLPPDTGLNVLMRTDFAYSAQPAGVYYVWNPGLLVNGVTYEADGRKRPAQLAGYIPSNKTYPITAGTQVALHHADFFNDGEKPIELMEMIMSSSQFTSESGYSVAYPELNQTSWRVNPTSGPQWMPRPEPIPAGNIAPFNHGVADTTDEGPQAYVFPNGILLHPRQRVGVKVGNLMSGSNQTLDICLFGLLEVE